MERQSRINSHAKWLSLTQAVSTPLFEQNEEDKASVSGKTAKICILSKPLSSYNQYTPVPPTAYSSFRQL